MNNEEKLLQLKIILGNLVNEENRSIEIQGKNVLSFTKFVLGDFVWGGLAWGVLSGRLCQGGYVQRGFVWRILSTSILMSLSFPHRHLYSKFFDNDW